MPHLPDLLDRSEAVAKRTVTENLPKPMQAHFLLMVRSLGGVPRQSAVLESGR